MSTAIAAFAFGIVLMLVPDAWRRRILFGNLSSVAPARAQRRQKRNF